MEKIDPDRLERGRGRDQNGLRAAELNITWGELSEEEGKKI
jgi:hypothetical protein